MVATTYVTTGVVEGASPGGDPMVTWAQIGELAAMGHEIGAHSQTHPQLDTLPLPAVRHEVADSRARLQDRTGLPIASFAYPHGYSDARVRRVVREPERSRSRAASRRRAQPAARPPVYARPSHAHVHHHRRGPRRLARGPRRAGRAGRRAAAHRGLAVVPPRPGAGRPRGGRSRPDGQMRPDGAVHTVHPALLRAFGALDGAGVAWCLLRGEAELRRPAGRCRPARGPGRPSPPGCRPRGGGLPARPRAWGKGAHRGYVGRDTASDRFFELDVESSVEFGPSAHFAVNWLRPKLRTDAATALLAARRRVGPLAVPDADDGFWALLLHCIVDKRAVADRHAARLAELLPQARPDGVFGRIVTAHCPSGWDAARVLTTARDADWPALVALGARLPGRAGVSQRATAGLGRGLCRLAVDVGRTRRGLSVAVLGPDGAGKSTLTQGIASSFGLPARVVYMGLWQGEDGTARPLPLAALAAARRPFRSWRRAAVTRWHQARGRLVVLDRHPYDALLPPAPPHVALKRLFFSLLARTAPAPSVVLVLDVPADVAAQRRPEEDPAALAVARGEYLALARRLPRAVVLDADRSPEALRAAAVDRIWQAVLDVETRR